MKADKKILLEEKLNSMRVYEEELYGRGVCYVAGVDEVGRGPLAGPVVAVALVLPTDFSVLGIDDSKKLSEKKRKELYGIIIEQALAYGMGVVSNEEIDEINILEATKKAMQEAVLEANQNLMKSRGKNIEHVLIDALKLESVNLPQTFIVKGDEKSISIAAASIVAKVTRDNMMDEFHKKYPHYSFDKNKGYGTKAHYEGISEHGICEIHRKSFLKKIL